jgi:putrescine importer
VSVISLAAIWVDLTKLASIVSFGALVAFSAVNLTVIKHYFVDAGDRGGGGFVNNLVLPLIGFGLTVWLWFSLSGYALVFGLCWFAIGFLWLLVVTRAFSRPTPVLAMED